MNQKNITNKENSIAPIIEEFEILFSKINGRFFNGELQKPVITISPDTTKGAYGWCTSWKAWTNKNSDEQLNINLSEEDIKDIILKEGYYEINICAEYLNRPFEETAETLIHEMVHLYCSQFGIKDTSRSGTYHNKKFKKEAERHGLNVEKDEKYGWCKTSLNDESKDFFKNYPKENFKLHRKNLSNIFCEKQSKQLSHKYMCSCEKNSVWKTKDPNLICGFCGERLQKVS